MSWWIGLLLGWVVIATVVALFLGEVARYIRRVERRQHRDLGSSGS